VDKLQAAITGAVQDTLTQGVQKGLLTQNQANALQQRFNNLGAAGLFGLFGFGNAGNAQIDVRASIESAGLDAAAKALGMTTADLQTALKTQTLLQLAQQKNVDVTKLRTAIADAEKAAIDAAVKAGQLTQAQGDALKANITPNNIDLNRGFRRNTVPGNGKGVGRGNGKGNNGFGPNGMGPDMMGPNGMGPGMMGPNGMGPGMTVPGGRSNGGQIYR